MKRFLFALALASAATAVRADDQVKLTRDELASVKKKLVAIADAVGMPAGYAKKDEDFSLPTESSQLKGGKFQPIYGSVNRSFVGASMKKGEAEHKKLAVDYQKKMAEAQAKGDFAEMSRLGMEMSQQSGKVQGEMLGDADKGNLSLNVTLNSYTTETLDPDAILLEKPGVIAIKRDNDDNMRATVYFDPVSLKNTKDLSSVEIKSPEGGTSKKTQVTSIQADIQGPAAAIEAWIKKIDTKAVLAQVN